MVEYLNPQPHTIQLSSPDKSIIKIPGRSKIVLSDWYMSYCPKYLRVVRIISEPEKKLPPKEIPKKNIKYAPAEQKKPNDKKNSDVVPPQLEIKPLLSEESAAIPIKEHRVKARAQTPARLQREQKKLVGTRAKEDSNKLFWQACQANKWSISNNIGVGILSYNRLPSLKRLIGSIRQYTDLSKTTVFVSDESTDETVKNWLRQQTDIVVMTDQPQLGIAGNTNRLLRCLNRFKYCLILNDDVEILQEGWETFYRNAHQSTNIHHFCYQQAGVYGSKKNSKGKPLGGHKLKTIEDKPHGAVIFYTNEMFNRIGFFDEQFGIYGMEHVDWSTRASHSGLQHKGYHDIEGSDQFFKIHQEPSAVQQRSIELAKARELYKKLESPSRIYVNPTKASQVPSISVVIPIRDIGRKDAVRVVVNSIRSQLFPNVEIIIAEQDEEPKVQEYKLAPRRHFFAKNRYKQQPFTKAMAFNLGVANASYDKVVLQDADIVCPSDYLKKIYGVLEKYDGTHIGSKVLYLTQEASNHVAHSHEISEKDQCERVVTYYEGGSLACTRRAYFMAGGFNEIFEGYGIEDCDFFDRLKYSAKFYNERTEDLIHLWHGRTDGWTAHHRRNKQIYTQIKKQFNMTSYIRSLIKKIKMTYPEVTKELEIELSPNM